MNRTGITTRRSPAPSVAPSQRATAWRGATAGVAGGVLAAWAMGAVHRLLTRLSRTEAQKLDDGDDSTVKAAARISEGVFHHVLTREEKDTAGLLVHYAFGAGVASVYGAMAEAVPIVTRGAGIPFGLIVWLGAHVLAVPALGLSEPVTRSSLRKEGLELAAHAVYGAVTELSRRAIAGEPLYRRRTPWHPRHRTS